MSLLKAFSTKLDLISDGRKEFRIKKIKLFLMILLTLFRLILLKKKKVCIKKYIRWEYAYHEEAILCKLTERINEKLNFIQILGITLKIKYVNYA